MNLIQFTYSVNTIYWDNSQQTLNIKKSNLSVRLGPAKALQINECGLKGGLEDRCTESRLIRSTNVGFFKEKSVS